LGDYLAFMADLAGEPRYAAAAGGRFGFKPSHGTVSRAGLIGLMPSLEAVGLLGNHPADVAAAMAEIAGFDGKDFSLEAEPLAGFPVRPPKTESKPVLGRPAGCEARLSPAAREIFSAGLKKLEGAGFPVREVPWPGDETFRDLHRVIGSVEASSSCGKFDGVRYGLRADSANNWNDMYLKTRAASFSTFLKTLLFQGAFFQFESYGTFERAARIRARLIREIGQLFETVDLIISPVRPETPAAESAREVDQTYAAFSLTLPANVTGCPALAFSLSGGREASDPGLQVMGGFRSDAFLLACGKRLFETLTGGA
ncbi:MAG TPA: amidase family protein, partial [bacterium]|nr:amidase family protein [bacterium]